MILSTVFGLAIWGQAVLPGSQLDLTEATAQAGAIFVGKISGISNVWTFGFLNGRQAGRECGLEGSVALKGALRTIPCQRIYLHTNPGETTPEVGPEYIVWLDRFRPDLHGAANRSILKVMPNLPATRQAVQTALSQLPRSDQPELSDTDLLLRGYNLTLEEAERRAGSIMVGRFVRFTPIERSSFRPRAALMGLPGRELQEIPIPPARRPFDGECVIAATSWIKQSVRTNQHNMMLALQGPGGDRVERPVHYPLILSCPEDLPAVNRNYIIFFQESRIAPSWIVKIIPDTPENRAALGEIIQRQTTPHPANATAQPQQ